MRRSLVPLVCSATAAMLALTACGNSSADDEAGKSSGPSGTLTMLTSEPTQGLDPNKAFADASRIPMGMIYETLVERDGSGKLVGSLADKWSVSDDGLTYTFNLRKGAKFSNGSPITAGDVVFSVNRMKTGDVMKGLLEEVSSVKAVGKSSVDITLSHPDNNFLATIGRPANAAILSQKAVEANPDYFTKPKVTSGPWTLTDYVPKSHATFDANTNYYNPPKIKTIRYTFSEDQTSHAAAIESGSADMASVGYSDVERLEKEDQLSVIQTDALAPLFWGWNRDKPPFDNKSVRQAVAWAVDREGRQQACWFGTGGITYGNILRPWDPAYVELNTYKASSRDEAVSKANALLDAAGWQANGGGVRTAHGVAGVPDGKPLAFKVPYEGNWPAAECHVQVLQQNLKEVGIKVTPQKYDPAAYWGDVAKGKFTMYHGGAGAADATDLYVNWFKSGGSLTALTTHLDDATIDAKIEKAIETLDPQESLAIYQELERWQAEELPMLVVGYQWPQVAITSKIKGYKAPIDDDSRTLVAASVA